MTAKRQPDKTVKVAIIGMIGVVASAAIAIIPKIIDRPPPHHQSLIASPQPQPVATNTSQTNNYFVVVLSTPEPTEAKKVADKLKVKAADFDAMIYNSSSGSLAVTVPTSTEENAKNIRAQLIRKRLAREDAYVSSGDGFTGRLQ